MNLARVVYWSLGGSLFILIFVFELIRHRRLREEYALLWLLFGGVFLGFSVWRRGIDVLARIIGIYYPPAAIFLIFFIAIFFILIHYSIVLSKLTAMNTTVVQELALLRFELQQNAAKLDKQVYENMLLRAEIDRLLADNNATRPENDAQGEKEKIEHE